MEGDVVGGLLELVVLGDEVGLAGELHQHADHGPVVLDVDVVADGALRGLAVGPLGGLGEPPLPEQLEGLVEVSPGLRQRLLGVHHADAGGLTQLLYVFGGELRHWPPPAVAPSGRRPPP